MVCEADQHEARRAEMRPRGSARKLIILRVKMDSNFSADASVLTIIHEYLQPCEFAMITNKHTFTTYINAAKIGQTEYLSQYQVKYYLNEALLVAAEYNQLTAIRNEAVWSAINQEHIEAVYLFVTLGTDNLDALLGRAARLGWIAEIRSLVKFGATNFKNALSSAYDFNQLEAVKLLQQLRGLQKI